MLNIRYLNDDEENEENTTDRIKHDEKTPDIKDETDLNACGFGDEYFLFESEGGKPCYEDIEAQWNIFTEWIEKTAAVRKQEEGEDSYACGLGREVLKWAKKRDPFGLYMLIRIHWVGFRDNYLLQDAPKIVREFIDEIMYRKMTEKEKWGTEEDRKPKGELIICANYKMTPKESYELTMKERRQKYDPQKHAERVKRDLEKMKKRLGNIPPKL